MYRISTCIEQSPLQKLLSLVPTRPNRSSVKYNRWASHSQSTLLFYIDSSHRGLGSFRHLLSSRTAPQDQQPNSCIAQDRCIFVSILEASYKHNPDADADPINKPIYLQPALLPAPPPPTISNDTSEFPTCPYPTPSHHPSSKQIRQNTTPIASPPAIEQDPRFPPTFLPCFRGRNEGSS